MNAFTQKPDLKDWINKQKVSATTSKQATKQARKSGIVQSPWLKPFSKNEHSGKSK